MGVGAALGRIDLVGTLETFFKSTAGGVPRVRGRGLESSFSNDLPFALFHCAEPHNFTSHLLGAFVVNQHTAILCGDEFCCGTRRRCNDSRAARNRFEDRQAKAFGAAREQPGITTRINEFEFVVRGGKSVVHAFWYWAFAGLLVWAICEQSQVGDFFARQPDCFEHDVRTFDPFGAEATTVALASKSQRPHAREP